MSENAGGFILVLWVFGVIICAALFAVAEIALEAVANPQETIFTVSVLAAVIVVPGVVGFLGFRLLVWVDEEVVE